MHTTLMKSARRVTSTNSDALLNGSLTLLIYTLIWHMHFWSSNAPRKALNAALKGLAAGNRLIPESFSGEIIWMHPENRPYLRALYAAILANVPLTASSGCGYAY